MGNLPGPLLHPTVAERFKDTSLTNGQLTEKTLYKYTHHYKHLQARYPGRRLNQFAVEDLAAYITHGDDGRLRAWKEQTSLGARNALVTLWRWASQPEVGLLPADDTTGEVLRRRVHIEFRTHREGYWLDPAEIRSLFASMSPDTLSGQRDRFIFQLFLGSGVRVFEAAAVTWPDLDLRRGTLRVNHGKGRGRGGKPRTVQMLPQLVEAAGQWREVVARDLGGVPLGQSPIPRARPQLAFGQRGERGRFLKVTGTDTVLDWNKGLTVGGLTLVVRQRTARAGLVGCAPHDLRRSYAGILEANDVPLQEISRNLGHADLNTTLRYLADNPAKRAKALQHVKAW